MLRLNLNACKNMFSLTENVTRKSMLVLNLYNKCLEIHVITIKNNAVQIRVHLSLKIFGIYLIELNLQISFTN